jgi:hypothetical protein
MAAQDFKKVTARLEQAKREMLWAIDALEDADTLREEYKLSKREEEKLLRQFHLELSRIESALARVLSEPSRPKKIHIVAEQVTQATLEGDVSSFDEIIGIDHILPNPQEAIIGPIPPHEDKDDTE